MSHAVPFSHIMPSYPERQVHWFGRAHLMKIKNNNKLVSDIAEEVFLATGKYVLTITIQYLPPFKQGRWQTGF